MTVFEDLKRLNTVLEVTSPRLVACSGGVDSMLLATLAHRQKPEETIVIHAVGPAVPAAASKRIKRWAHQEKWQLQLVNAGEFDDPEVKKAVIQIAESADYPVEIRKKAIDNLGSFKDENFSLAS